MPAKSDSIAPTVIALIGPGRGGTTITARILAAATGGVYPGETIRLSDWRPMRNGPFPDRICGCGLPTRECPFWSAVIAEVPALLDPDLAKEAERIHEALIAPGGMPSYVFRRDKWLEQLAPPPGYLEHLRSLFGAMAAQGEKPVVVTPASPRYASLLIRAGLDVRGMELLRDPRAVVQGWARRRDTPALPGLPPLPGLEPWRQAISWSGVVGQSWLVSQREIERFVRIRYEEFMVRPMSHMERALKALGVEQAHAVIEANDGGWYANLPAHHSSGANENRFESGRIRLSPDERWRQQISTQDQAVATVLTFPIAELLGYPLWPARS